MLLLHTLAHGQTEDKIYKHVVKDLSKGNYNAMLRHLEDFDAKDRAGSTFFHYKALANDSLEDYTNAITAYNELLRITPDDTASLNRSAYLKNILAIRSKCTKCKGSGYVVTETPCDQCKGTTMYKAPCKTCGGTKKQECGGCGGAGKIQAAYGFSPCGSCGGTGKIPCNRCNMTGVQDEKCRLCKNGMIVTKVKCPDHL
jgi:hypothetical protein